MSFTLNLGIGGLCLFVPDVDEAGKPLMHVLLPSGHDHRALLVHDVSAETGNAPTGEAKEHSLDQTCIDLTHIATSTPLQPPPPTVASLKDLCPPVPRALLEGCPAPGLSTRVTFAAGEARIDNCAHGAFWEFGGERQLPIRVVWSIEVDASELVVDVLKGGSPHEKITLRPFANLLDLWIFHLHSTEGIKSLPPLTKTSRPQPNEPAAHFTAFLQLLGGPTDVEPRFSKSEIIPGHLPSCYDPAVPGLDVGCIAATAPAVPRS